jgi:hypothetical protein
VRSTEGAKGAIVSALLGALGLFEFAYNRLAGLESIWPGEEGRRLISHRTYATEKHNLFSGLVLLRNS